MKTVRCIVAMVLLAWSGAVSSAHAETPAQILALVDQAGANFKDLTIESKMTIHEPGEKAGRVCTFSQLMKGDKTTIRFESPPDIKGMAFLFEGRDTIYAILPAFGNRIRRVGPNAQYQSLVGSDVALEDIASAAYTGRWQPTLVGTDGDRWVLELSLMPGKEAQFPKQKLWVDQKRHQAVQIEIFDDKGNKSRTITRTGWTRVEGSTEQWLPAMTSYVDHRRNDHRTTVEVVKARANSGLADGEFTKASLQRGVAP